MLDVVNTALNKIKDVQQDAVCTLMDSIISNTAVRSLYGTVMLSTNVQSVIQAQRLGTPATDHRKNSIVPKYVGRGGAALVNILGLVGLVDVSVVTQNVATALMGASESLKADFQETWEKALVMPNIEGIPITTRTIRDSRKIEVGEQAMIVQDTVHKRYWTDNAVPRLKEWELDGYLTPVLHLDPMFLIKPSLTMQADFLDRCAKSRRPVLFKDNRGRFQLVQITNIDLEEEASYNNAIHIQISLKEYNPYTVTNASVSLRIADSSLEKVTDNTQLQKLLQG